jgi:hypothetical protein
MKTTLAQTFNNGRRHMGVMIPLILAAVLLLSAAQTHAALANFITRSGDVLKDGTSTFRFIGYDMCDLAQSWRGGVHTPDPWEQEDAMCTISQSGGRVVRVMGISVKTASDPAGVKFIESLVSGTLQYNESVWRGLDKVLQLANAYGMRVMIPLTMVGTEPRGGAGAFAAFRGCTQAQFFTDSNVQNDWKNFLSYLTNRTNYYTGIQYKNDKSILCWELGNELVPGTDVDTWVGTMSSYLKGLDSNHLIMDGEVNPTLSNPVNPVTMAYSTIDLVTNHLYYSHQPVAQASRNASKGIKPIIFGEFGYGVSVTTMSPCPDLHPFLDEIIGDGSSGALLWNMAYRNMDGGFYWENVNDKDPYRCYRWPGISGIGATFDEFGVLTMMNAYSYKMVTGGTNAPVLPVPDAPQIVPITSQSNICWRGSVGATSYKIMRATSLSGSYTVIGDNLSEIPSDPNASYAGFNDTDTLSMNTPYYYKMKAINSTGTSNESNIECFMNPTAYIIDNTTAAPAFTTNGTWTTVSGSSGAAGYNSDYMWNSTTGTNAWAQWTPTITTGTNYDVYMYWSASSNRPTAAPVMITYSGGTNTQYVNQQINGSQWNYLGTYSFASGTAGSVKLLCSSSGTKIADAMQFVRHDAAKILLYDNFEDGVLDNWTVSNPWNNIEAATATYDPADNTGVMQLVSSGTELLVSAGDPSWTNYSAEAKIKIIGSNPTYPGILFRRQDDNNYYMFRLSSPSQGQAQLFKKVNGGSLVQTGTYAMPIVSGSQYDLKVVVSGTSINCYVGGTSAIVTTGTYFSSGNIGFRVLSGTAYIGSMTVLPQ